MQSFARLTQATLSWAMCKHKVCGLLLLVVLSSAAAQDVQVVVALHLAC